MCRTRPGMVPQGIHAAERSSLHRRPQSVSRTPLRPDSQLHHLPPSVSVQDTPQLRLSAPPSATLSQCPGHPSAPARSAAALSARLCSSSRPEWPPLDTAPLMYSAREARRRAKPPSACQRVLIQRSEPPRRARRPPSARQSVRPSARPPVRPSARQPA